MNTLRFEIRTLFSRRYTWFIIAAFILLKILFGFMSTVNTDDTLTTKADKLHYSEYIEIPSRFLNTGKRTVSYRRTRFHQSSRAELNRLNDDLLNGRLKSDSDFSDQYMLLEPTLNKKAAYEKIAQQYQYIQASPSNRFFMNTTGWQSLIGKAQMDYIMLLFLILFIIPAITMDFEGGTLDTFRTSTNGTTFIKARIAAVLVATALFGILSLGIDAAAVFSRYNISHGDFPILSLQYFASSEMSISLLQGYLFVCVIKALGYLAFVSLVICFAGLFRRQLLTLFSSAAILVLCNFVFLKESDIYHFPIPIGFLLGAGYLRGNEYTSVTASDGSAIQELIFRKTPTSELIF